MTRQKRITLGPFLLVVVALSVFAETASEKPVPKHFESPLLITDVGQGNNAKLLKILLKRQRTITFHVEEQAGPEDLEGVKSLLMGVGASSKGLGAAGLDFTQEMTRTKALIEAAKENDLPIIGVHIGGMARRGELSDKFIEEVIRNSDTFVAWRGGDEDGFLSKLAAQNDIDFHLVEKKSGVGKTLGEFIAPPVDLSL